MRSLFVTPNDYIARARELRRDADHTSDQRERMVALFEAQKLERQAYARYATICAAD
jgi:hypothetical protein